MEAWKHGAVNARLSLGSRRGAERSLRPIAISALTHGARLLASIGGDSQSELPGMASALPDPQPKSSDVTALLADAVALHQAGRLADAERTYSQILAVDPEHCDCLHLVGVILHQRGKHAQAVAQIDLSLAKNPNNASAWNNRGTALYKLKRLDEAIASYDRALAIAPAFAFALSNRGAALFALKRFDEALTSYDHALAVQPDYLEALSNRGNALKELKRFEEALASFDRAIAVRPDYAEALLNRGLVLQELRRLDEALASYDRALAIRPDFVESLSNRGSVLNELKRFDEGLASCDRALALQPQYAEAHANRANALQSLKRFEEAMASCDRAAALQPGLARVHYNRGNALHMLRRFEDALASYDTELTRHPDFAGALVNRGLTLESLKRFEGALASYQRAYAVRSEFADAHYNEALCRLLIGDLRRGWEEHEWRWQTRQLGQGKRNFPQPLWDGCREIAGRTVLLHAEQGFGDTIQFCRYVPLVASRGARVILEVQRPLYELMSALRGVAQVANAGNPLPQFDLHCPLLSLPRAFRTELATIPSATPYLHAPEEQAKHWSARLGPRTRPRIGIAWSGRPEHKNDYNRSIGLDAFLSIFAGLDVSLVSLQREVRDADAAVLRKRSDVLHFGDELMNFSDTAALISSLDLVVSVDTSVAHLAGALARPVWVLLPFIPDWRWLLDRDDSPWYPTARLFRQDDTRAWNNVFVRVHDALYRRR
jgi:tetratricopeptide (TPR) repeat protein